MNSKTKYLISGVLGFLSTLLILFVRTVDVAAVGPKGTSIGLSHLNKFVFDFFGVNIRWYHITDWLGVAALLTALGFAAVGLFQWVKRKSILKVDRSILVLGGLYCVTLSLYMLFETVVVNYRPIIMPGCVDPEASFPSSHTMLVCVIMGSTMLVLDDYVNNIRVLRVLKTACAALIGITVVGRLISGVHWFTDIIGSCLISSALLMLYSAVISSTERTSGRQVDNRASRRH